MNFTITLIQKLFFALLLIANSSPIFTQNLQVTNGNVDPFTPQNLISNVFLGEGVNVLNIQYQGSASAVGYFTGGQNAVGITRGIVMTTGYAASTNNEYGADGVGNDFSDYDNNSTATDTDLKKLYPPSDNPQFHNIAKYIITFVPTSDTIQFRYCFGSEEYPEFGCSKYNDVFGFFISGPGYPTPTNIAKIPGTNLPVTINNLHPQNPVDPFCTPKYIQYYKDNNGSNKQPTYDGFTDVFTAMAVVQPCQTYTIKLVIADVGDENFDSGVFLEAKSFKSNALKGEFLTVSNDATATEGCLGGTLRFSIPEPLDEPLNITYNIWGTGTVGTDISAIPASMTIPVGQTSVEVPIQVFEDNVVEGAEFVALDFQKDPCRRDTIFIKIRENILRPMTLPNDTSLCISGNFLLNLDASVPTQTPPPAVFQNNSTLSLFPDFVTRTSSLNVTGVQPAVLGPGMIRSVCINIDHNWVDDLDIYLVSPGGQFLELTTDNGGSGDKYSNTCFTPTATQKINAMGVNPPFTGSFLPEGDWADLWAGGNRPSNGTWKLQIYDDQFGVWGTLRNWSITFEPTYRIDYQWTPATAVDCSTCPKVQSNLSDNTELVVVATDNYGCRVQDTLRLEIEQTLPAPQITCSNAGPDVVTFSWTNVAGSTGLEMNINGTGWTAAAANNQLIMNGLQPGTLVELQVRGIGSNLECPPLVATQVCRTCEIPVLQAAVDATSCFNTADGKLTVQVVNQTLNPPYTYSIGNQSNSTGVFENLPAGTLAVRVVDTDGCQKIENIEITSPPALTPKIEVVKPISCNGMSDASLQASVSGGTGASTILWANGQTQPILNNLSAGNYAFTATDSKGCTAAVSVALQNPPALQIVTAAENAKCFGTATGIATAQVSGGSGGYTYLWSNGQTNATAIGLPAGNYTVTTTDASGCTLTAFLTVGQPNAIAATVSTTPARCFGEANGTAQVLPTGGTGNFNFKWSDPLQQNTQQAINLSAGNYLVTITDANLCTHVQAVQVAQPNDIQTLVTVSNAKCHGGAEGRIEIEVTGGNGNYQFTWQQNPILKDKIAEGLPAGNYQITVTDANNCSKILVARVDEPTPMTVNSQLRDVKCHGIPTGRIEISTSGGTAPYSFYWNSGNNSPNLINIAAGNYSLTVSDGNTCTQVFNFEIRQPQEITANWQLENVRCHGDATGKIECQPQGGTGNFSAKWQSAGGFSSQNLKIEQLPAGIYFLTLTDAEGCIKVFSQKIEQPTAPLITNLPAIADTVCFGKSDGTITAQPSGGTAPYQFAWSVGGQSGQKIGSLPIGFYHLTVTDANGCKKSDSTAVTQQQPIFAVLAADPALCHNGNDGKARVTTILYGATAHSLQSFNYRWNTSPPQTGIEASQLKAGAEYQVVATDASGCTATQTIRIGNPEPVVARIDSTGDVKCFGDATGWAVASGSGGAGNYHFLWSPGVPNQTAQRAENMPAGKYFVTVTDAHGCFQKQEIEIRQPSKLKNAFEKSDVKCFGESNGKAKSLASGGVGSYRYFWENGAQTAEIQGLVSGIYRLVLSDANGCTTQDSVIIAQPDEPLFGSHTKKDAVCFGSATGEIQMQPDGGEPPYRFSLDGKNWNGSSRQIGLKAGVYQPHIMDKNGCSLALPEIRVGQRSAIELNLGRDTVINLGQEIQLFPKIKNATPPIEYIWSAEDSLWLSCMSCPNPVVRGLQFQNTFELYIVDSAGCTAEDRIVIIVQKIRNVHVPTGFSPNTDFANDKLLVHGQEGVKILDFRVFDRWGELLWNAQNFDINDSNVGWDGSFRNQNMPPGIYTWLLEVEYIDGVREIFKGHTTLIR